jgi:hypothetical protein
MANTYTLIQTISVTSNTASVTFSSIPQTYTDLLVKLSVRTTAIANAWSVLVSYNGSSSNFVGQRLYGTGSSVASGGSGNYVTAATGTLSTSLIFSNGEFYIPKYTSSLFKPFMSDDASENNGTEAYANLTQVLWSDTSAISSITLTSASPETLLSGSQFYLYGISNA